MSLSVRMRWSFREPFTSPLELYECLGQGTDSGTGTWYGVPSWITITLLSSRTKARTKLCAHFDSMGASVEPFDKKRA